MSKICSICGDKIGIFDENLKLKDGIVCSKEIKKYGFSKDPKSDIATTDADEWAKRHTVADLKQLIQNGKKFTDINLSTCCNCGRKLGFWSTKYYLKDGALCDKCFTKYKVADHANHKNMEQYLSTLTVKECLQLIKNPSKLDQAKINYGYSTVFTNDVNQAKEKEKEKIEKGHRLDLAVAEQNKKDAEYRNTLNDFERNASASFSHYIFSDKKQQILVKKGLMRNPKIINYSDLVSYRINQQGHNEYKHHGITRAVVGGVLAGSTGAIVGATTGGKNTDYIDHLGLIINLKDGSNFELVFIRKIDQVKSNSFSARSAIKQMNTYISMFDAIIAQNQSRPASSQQKLDPADEIRKYKKLADDGIITQAEFQQKKEQLLGL